MATVGYDNITIRFTENEIWDLITSVRGDLEVRKDDAHYKRCPSSFDSNNSQKLRLFKTLCLSIGRLAEYAELMAKIDARMKSNKQALEAKEPKTQGE